MPINIPGTAGFVAFASVLFGVLLGEGTGAGAVHRKPEYSFFTRYQMRFFLYKQCIQQQINNKDTVANI